MKSQLLHWTKYDRFPLLWRLVGILKCQTTTAIPLFIKTFHFVNYPFNSSSKVRQDNYSSDRCPFLKQASPRAQPHRDWHELILSVRRPCEWSEDKLFISGELSTDPRCRLKGQCRENSLCPIFFLSDKTLLTKAGKLALLTNTWIHLWRCKIKVTQLMSVLMGVSFLMD